MPQNPGAAGSRAGAVDSAQGVPASLAFLGHEPDMRPSRPVRSRLPLPGTCQCDMLPGSATVGVGPALDGLAGLGKAVPARLRSDRGRRVEDNDGVCTDAIPSQVRASPVATANRI